MDLLQKHVDDQNKSAYAVVDMVSKEDTEPIPQRPTLTALEINGICSESNRIHCTLELISATERVALKHLHP